MWGGRYDTHHSGGKRVPTGLTRQGNKYREEENGSFRKLPCQTGWQECHSSHTTEQQRPHTRTRHPTCVHIRMQLPLETTAQTGDKEPPGSWNTNTGYSLFPLARAAAKIGAPHLAKPQHVSSTDSHKSPASQYNKPTVSNTRYVYREHEFHCMEVFAQAFTNTHTYVHAKKHVCIEVRERVHTFSPAHVVMNRNMHEFEGTCIHQHICVFREIRIHTNK